MLRNCGARRYRFLLDQSSMSAAQRSGGTWSTISPISSCTMGDCPQGLQSTIHESRSTARELSGPRPLCRDPNTASPPEHTVWRSLAGLSPQLALTPRYMRHSRPILPCEDLARDHKCNRPLLQLGTVSPSCTLPDFPTKCDCVIMVDLHFTPEGSVCSRILSQIAPGCWSIKLA